MCRRAACPDVSSTLLQQNVLPELPEDPSSVDNFPEVDFSTVECLLFIFYRLLVLVCLAQSEATGPAHRAPAHHQDASFRDSEQWSAIAER